MNFDPSHLFPSGDIPHVVIYQLGKRIFHCHFSDNDGTTNVHWRPGKGKIDWTAVMKSLVDTGFDGVVSIELEDVPGVARGTAQVPGVYRDNRVATEAFDEENRASLAYIVAICERLAIPVA
jgi:sugar phosphate isomerase/epimerase